MTLSNQRHSGAARATWIAWKTPPWVGFDTGAGLVCLLAEVPTVWAETGVVVGVVLVGSVVGVVFPPGFEGPPGFFLTCSVSARRGLRRTRSSLARARPTAGLWSAEVPFMSLAMSLCASEVRVLVEREDPGRQARLARRRGDRQQVAERPSSPHLPASQVGPRVEQPRKDGRLRVRRCV